MREKRKIFKCDKTCDANMGGECMWLMDKELFKLAEDKNYKMCEKLREATLKKYRIKRFLNRIFKL